LEKQKLALDSNTEKLISHFKSDSTHRAKSINDIKTFIKNDSATTQKLLDAFLEKSKNDAAFFKQISATGKILSPQDSIFVIRLDSAVNKNLDETDKILDILKQESTFYDIYINLSLFTMGIIGGTLLNGNEGWGFYAAEVGGGLLAWGAISRKHAIDDDVDDFQQINDDLGTLQKNIRNFRRKLAENNFKYPNYLSEKITLVDKKYELLNHSLSLDNIFDGVDLKRGSRRYNLLKKSNSWLDMMIVSAWGKVFYQKEKENTPSAGKSNQTLHRKKRRSKLKGSS
jgi:hypothetical protein